MPYLDAAGLPTVPAGERFRGKRERTACRPVCEINGNHDGYSKRNAQNDKEALQWSPQKVSLSESDQ